LDGVYNFNELNMMSSHSAIFKPSDLLNQIKNI